jgi:hypothetical protein
MLKPVQYNKISTKIMANVESFGILFVMKENMANLGGGALVLLCWRIKIRRYLLLL